MRQAVCLKRDVLCHVSHPIEVLFAGENVFDQGFIPISDIFNIQDDEFDCSEVLSLDFPGVEELQPLLDSALNDLVLNTILAILKPEDDLEAGPVWSRRELSDIG